MIIVNVQDHADQIQQNAANLQQITKGDILIHHTDHLPTVVNSAVGVEAKENSNRLPFQVCPRFFIISHYAKNVKQPHHCRIVPVGGAAFLLPCSRAIARLYYYNSIACHVRSVCPGSTAFPNRACPKLPASFQYSELSSETV